MPATALSVVMHRAARALLREALSGGHWITISDEEGVDTHLYISHGGGGNGKKGQVIAGPRHLIGANIAHLPPAPHFRKTEHKEGHTPTGAQSHPSYTEHNFQKKVFGKFGPGVGKIVDNPLDEKTQAEAHAGFNAAHMESRAQAGKSGPAPTKEEKSAKLQSSHNAIEDSIDQGHIDADTAGDLHKGLNTGEKSIGDIEHHLATAKDAHDVAAAKAKDAQDAKTKADVAEAHADLMKAVDAGAMTIDQAHEYKAQVQAGAMTKWQAYNAAQDAIASHKKQQATNKAAQAKIAVANSIAEAGIKASNKAGHITNDQAMNLSFGLGIGQHDAAHVTAELDKAKAAFAASSAGNKAANKVKSDLLAAVTDGAIDQEQHDTILKGMESGQFTADTAAAGLDFLVTQHKDHQEKIAALTDAHHGGYMGGAHFDAMVKAVKAGQYHDTPSFHNVLNKVKANAKINAGDQIDYAEYGKKISKVYAAALHDALDDETLKPNDVAQAIQDKAAAYKEEKAKTAKQKALKAAAKALTAGDKPVKPKTPAGASVPVQHVAGQASAHIDPHNAAETMAFQNRVLRKTTNIEGDSTAYNITPQNAKSEIAQALGKKFSAFVTDEQATEILTKLGTLHDHVMSTPQQNLASSIVQQWAGTSADHNASAIALQLAAQAEFGLDNWTGAQGHTGEQNHIKAESLVADPTVGPTLKKCLRTIYEHTQASFKKAGITHVTLTRGVNNVVSDTVRAAYDGKKGGAAVLDVPSGHLTTNPLTSWATHPDVSTNGYFLAANATSWPASKTTTNTLLMATIPVEHVFSHTRSGMGCLDEDEMVCLGHDKPYTVIAAESPATAKIEAMKILQKGRAPKAKGNTTLEPKPGVEPSKATILPHLSV